MCVVVGGGGGTRTLKTAHAISYPNVETEYFTSINIPVAASCVFGSQTMQTALAVCSNILRHAGNLGDAANAFYIWVSNFVS